MCRWIDMVIAARFVVGVTALFAALAPSSWLLQAAAAHAGAANATPQSAQPPTHRHPPYLDLGLPPQLDPSLVRRFIDAFVHDTDQHMACTRRLDEWAAGDAVAFVREREELSYAMRDITAGIDSFHWRTNPDARAKFIAVASGRARMYARQAAREQALVDSLAGIVGGTRSDETWQVLGALIELRRSSGVSSSQYSIDRLDLSAAAGAARSEPALPASDSEFDRARRAYLTTTAPLRARRAAAWQAAIERTVTLEDGMPNTPAYRQARREWADLSLALQLANEWWAAFLGATVGGPEGDALARRLHMHVCPRAAIGWSCNFEGLHTQVDSLCDPDTARRLIVDLDSRCRVLRDIHWGHQRTQIYKVLAGDGVVNQSDADANRALVEALCVGAAAHLMLLQGMGCDLSQDTCAQELFDMFQSGNFDITPDSPLFVFDTRFRE